MNRKSESIALDRLPLSEALLLVKRRGSVFLLTNVGFFLRVQIAYAAYTALIIWGTSLGTYDTRNWILFVGHEANSGRLFG